ncbi:MAG: hypothetical protein ABL989_02635 [Gammaproteobacteria bacterium]
MRMAGLIGTLALVAGSLQAAPPPEPVETRLVAVDPAGREIVADGMTWALSSTARISIPGKERASLRDLQPGAHVRLELVPTDGEVPVVSRITVLPD